MTRIDSVVSGSALDKFASLRAPRNGMVGHILTSAALDGREQARVSLIKDVMLSAGCDTVQVGDEPTVSPVTAAIGRVVSRLVDRKTRHDQVVVTCDSNQIHLTAKHIEKLVKAARDRNSAVYLDTSASTFAGQAGLQFLVSAAIAGSSAVKTAIPADDSDTQAAYEVFTRTHVPNLFIIELNSTCNFKCHYCPFHGDDTVDPRYVGPKGGIEMKIDDFRRLITEVAEWPKPYFEQVTTVAPFSRGEFFLADNWREALRIIRAAGLRSYVCSNASVLSEPILEEVIRGNLLDHLTISVDAVSEEQNFKTRRNTKFKKIERLVEFAARLRREANPNMFLQLNCTLVDENFRDYDAYVEKWVDYFDVICAGPKHTLNKATKQSAYEYQYSPFGVDNGVASHATACTTLFRTIEVYSNGDLTLCAACGSERIKVGNVLQDGILNIRNKSEIFNRYADMFRKNGQGDDYCGSCTMHKESFHRTESRGDLEYYITPAAWTVRRVRK